MDIQTVTYNHTAAPERFADALASQGVVCLVDHPTDPQLVLKAHKMWGDFFVSDDKAKYAQEGSAHSGYFAAGLHDTYEGECYHYFPWAPNPQGMNHVTQKLFDHMDHLSQTFLGWLDAEMPNRVKARLEGSLRQLPLKSPRSHLRVISCNKDKPLSFLNPKADPGLLTLLFVGPHTHFKIWDENGWQGFVCEPGSMLVSGGEVLDHLSDGLYGGRSHAYCDIVDAIHLSQAPCLLPFFAKPHEKV